MIGPPTQRARTHQRRTRHRQPVTPVDNKDQLYVTSLSSITTPLSLPSTTPLLSSTSPFESGFCGVQRIRFDATDRDTVWRLPTPDDDQRDKDAADVQFINSKLNKTNSRLRKCSNNNNNNNNNYNNSNNSSNSNNIKSKDKNYNIDNNTRTTVLQQARRQRGRARNHGIVFLLFAIAVTFLALFFPPVMGATSDSIEEETTSPASAAVTETTTVTVVKTRIGNDIGGSIDLLAALQLHNTTRQGVTQVPGLVRLKPAYYLEGEERDLQVSQSSFERAASLLRRVPEFTVAASLKQEEANSGTIIAFSHGNNRYLELQSSGRKDELRLHYVSRRDGAVHVEAFPFRLADGVWHRVALSISGSQVELLVDCHPLYRRLLRPGPPDTNFTLPQLQLWVGQRNAKHFLFKGALQDVKLIPGAHGYLSQCPQLDTSCPTCGQFSILQNTVEQLMHNLNELTHRLAAAEGRISKVEECECQKSCRSNGTIHEDGSTWEEGCQQCVCVHGEIECRPTPCAPVNCKHPVIPQGKCCPVCLKECFLKDTIYDHGVKIFPRPCFECECFDGSFTCQSIDTKTRCPPLPCPPSEQITVAEECCKFCPGVDYCAKGHNCHTNASCLNLQTTYACHCNIGFQGDGQNCHDVDECKQQGGLEGHHCNKNTRCVNVVGSYTCECLPGYQRVDKFNCAELDECTTGRHLCSEHATCVNTPGSYYCICKDGYTGDGYTCKPVCNQTCQNGGECIAPGKCSCRRGYIGNSCELDLDECASDLHRCHHSSTCFNMPGWYYCRCKPGYRSALHDSTQGTHCLDIDECNDQTLERRHTCHPSARCVNTDGGYECACPREDTSLDQCSLNCWYEDREIGNSETFAPAGNPCRQCTCKDGVVTCRDPICDCSAPSSRRDKCCPQCDPAASCRHQELHHLVFRSGERWIYQCQTCECLYGEIDCWQMECPPVTCSNPVTEDGDCCPRCEDDPCARENHINSTSYSSSSGHPQPCSYAGIIHESGSAWQDPHDKCTTCECKVPYCAQLESAGLESSSQWDFLKDGQLCCSYDYGCAGDNGLEQHTVTISQPDPVFVPSDPSASSKSISSPETAVPTIGSSTNIEAPASSSSSITIDKSVDYYSTLDPRVDKLLYYEAPNPSSSSSLSSSETVTSSSSSSVTTSSVVSSIKTSLPPRKRSDPEMDINIEQQSRGIAKNIISFPKPPSVRRNQIGNSRTLVAISANNNNYDNNNNNNNNNNDPQKNTRGSISRPSYLSASSRLVGSNDAT
ncbi:protein kinase C-binding protein NELL1-like isoform X2 [Microplitis mediator]|uniref:protein kinase C-binding protein NELL1-like isoform X2 n=1 Tax=Microplitis mediator TaxID=375433 RepID=UPI0025538DB1|nr:protein kinase C-binding protein NELL1-like isoform X2 [Microplitis mediator]